MEEREKKRIWLFLFLSLSRLLIWIEERENKRKLYFSFSLSRLPIWMKEREKKRRRDVENYLEQSKLLYSNTIMRRKNK